MFVSAIKFINNKIFKHYRFVNLKLTIYKKRNVIYSINALSVYYVVLQI